MCKQLFGKYCFLNCTGTETETNFKGLVYWIHALIIIFNSSFSYDPASVFPKKLKLQWEDFFFSPIGLLSKYEPARALDLNSGGMGRSGHCALGFAPAILIYSWSYIFLIDSFFFGIPINLGFENNGCSLFRNLIPILHNTMVTMYLNRNWIESAYDVYSSP